MPGLLLSGPAGAGKSAEARRELARATEPAVAIDFQSIYAMLLMIERQPDGRYPEREPRHEYALPMAEYVRRAAITAALAQEVLPIVTNSDGNASRRGFLLDLLGPGAQERVIDPGRITVEARLSVDGELSEQCGQAIRRWYGRR